MLTMPEFTDEEKLQGYRIGKWHEHKNYECVHCQYSTLWIEKMQDHLATSPHEWAYPGQNPPVIEESTSEPTY